MPRKEDYDDVAENDYFYTIKSDFMASNPDFVQYFRQPYDGAKDYFYISDVDDRDYLVALIKGTIPALK